MLRLDGAANVRTAFSIYRRTILLVALVRLIVYVMVFQHIKHYTIVDCGCNIGGSISPLCDRVTGQCVCRQRVQGRACDEPLQLHYFPTLYQFQYEVEDGYTPTRSPVRFGFDQGQFPEYSWRGYAVFSQIQVNLPSNLTVSLLLIFIYHRMRFSKIF